MDVVVGMLLLAAGPLVLLLPKLSLTKTFGLVGVSSRPLEAWPALAGGVKRGHIAALSRLELDSGGPGYQTPEHSHHAEEEEQSLGTISRLVSGKFSSVVQESGAKTFPPGYESTLLK